MHIFQSDSLGIILVRFGKKIIVVMETEIPAVVDISEGRSIVDELRQATSTVA